MIDYGNYTSPPHFEWGKQSGVGFSKSWEIIAKACGMKDTEKLVGVYVGQNGVTFFVEPK